MNSISERSLTILRMKYDDCKIFEEIREAVFKEADYVSYIIKKLSEECMFPLATKIDEGIHVLNPDLTWNWCEVVEDDSNGNKKFCYLSCCRIECNPEQIFEFLKSEYLYNHGEKVYYENWDRIKHVKAFRKFIGWMEYINFIKQQDLHQKK